jgi:PAS domain S-box-containing protein
MGVQASMSISLLQNGRLWGLIICHHHHRKRVSFAMREAGVFISRMISTELASIEMRSKHELLDKVTQLKTVLLKSILTQSMQQVLQQLNPELLNCLNASGLIIVVENIYYTYGSTPNSTAIATLLNWIDKQTIVNVFSCHNLAEQFPPALAYPEIASGLIATMRSSAMKNCIIWLRKEQPRTVSWAGCYEQDLEQTLVGNFRLNPRTSFESRSELWRNRSTPWSEFENDIVETFGHTLSEGLAQKHKLQRTEKRLQTLIKDREEALNRLEKIASRVPGMVYQFHLRPDGSSCFPYSSVGIKDIYQLSPGQVREDASSVFALIHPDDYAEVQTSIQQSADNLTPWRHEYRVKFDDGTERWLSGNAMPEQNKDAGSGMLWHGFITDITERKQSENSQRLSNVALKAISQGVLITDTDIRILSINNAFELITGYTQAELYQQNCRLLQGPLTDPLTLNDIRLALKNASPFSGEILNYRKDGTTFWNELTISPVFDTQGRPINFVGTIRDINQRKAQQQQDKEHINQLAHVTRLGLMGEMASGIAHEVNQPLTAITTYTQVSLNLINSQNIDLIKLIEILHKTQQQALRAGEIIRRMRGLIKSNTKKITTANLNDLIHEAASLCFSELNHNQIQLTFELKSDLPLIDVDTIQIEQVIINLIRNSADALTNSPKNQQRTLSIQSQLKPNDGIVVRIKDNGIGIDEDLQQKILMPFFTTKAEGMGMGLSISRSIIEAHNGYLRFNSQIGIGSTFYFNLPVILVEKSLPK